MVNDDQRCKKSYLRGVQTRHVTSNYILRSHKLEVSIYLRNKE